MAAILWAVAPEITELLLAGLAAFGVNFYVFHQDEIDSNPVFQSAANETKIRITSIRDGTQGYIPDPRDPNKWEKLKKGIRRFIKDKR
jgi:hypothetical protein